MTGDHSKILVTCGAGFIGSHIVDRLLSEGFEVTVIDNLYTGRLENITKHSVGDVVDAKMLALKRESAPGEVFNIATGVAVTINELVEMLQEIMRKKILNRYIYWPRPEIKHSLADISKQEKSWDLNQKFLSERV